MSSLFLPSPLNFRLKAKIYCKNNDEAFLLENRGAQNYTTAAQDNGTKTSGYLNCFSKHSSAA